MGRQIVGRDPNLGRETFHFGTQNNLNLPFSSDRINATIYCLMRWVSYNLVQEIATVNSSGKMFYKNIFHKTICSRNVWVARIQNYFFSGSRQKVFAGPWTTARKRFWLEPQRLPIASQRSAGARLRRLCSKQQTKMVRQRRTVIWPVVRITGRRRYLKQQLKRQLFANFEKITAVLAMCVDLRFCATPGCAKAVCWKAY